MSTIFIFILLIIVAILLIAKQTKTGFTILIFAILCFLGAGCGLIPEMMLWQLQRPFLQRPPPKWENKNAIVLLGAGTIKSSDEAVYPTIMAYPRITEAAVLYFNCIKNHHQCDIIISGGDALQTGKSEAAVYQKMLIELGVDASDIMLESNSLNTFQNAEFTSRLLKQKKFDQIYLATSGIHLKRSLLYFSLFGIYAKPALSDYLSARVGFIPLGYNFAMMDFVIHEYLGIARFHVYQFLGWNKQPAP